jgi:hypothetical protein
MEATDRDRLIAEVIARSHLAGRAVWGYDSKSGRGGVARTASEVAGGWDRLCVEGDERWTLLPRPG